VDVDHTGEVVHSRNFAEEDGFAQTMRRLLLALLALLVLAPAASAAEVKLEYHFCGCDPSSGDEDTTTLVVRAAPGEANRLSISAGPSGVLVEDAGPELTGECRPVGSRGRFCQPVDETLVELGDGDDTVQVDGLGGLVRGGPGTDSIRVTSGGFTLDGGPGPDLFDAGTGAGASVTYRDRTEPINASVDGTADDGAAGEGDDLRGSITAIEGGAGNDVLEGGPETASLAGWEGDDVLRGGSHDEFLTGGAGDDEIAGGGGDDSLTGETGADILSGGEGDDEVSYAYSAAPVRLSIGGGPDDGAAGERDEIRDDMEALVGGRGADVLIGDDRANALKGLGGRDVVIGRGGPDVLYGMGGDQLNAGGGEDRVLAGSLDTVHVADGDADRVSCGGFGLEIRRDRGVDEFTSCAPALAWVRAVGGPDARGRVRLRLRCAKRSVVSCAGRLVLRMRGRAVSRSARFGFIAPGRYATLTVDTKVRRIPRGACLRAVATSVRPGLPSRTRSTHGVRCTY
jgi:hypothetical protein